MKISGLIALSAMSLLVQDRTDTAAKIYRVDLSAATNILGSAWDATVASPSASTTTLETLCESGKPGDHGCTENAGREPSRPSRYPKQD